MKKFSLGIIFSLMCFFSVFSLAEDASSAGGSSEPSTEKLDDDNKDKGKQKEKEKESEEDEEPDCE